MVDGRVAFATDEGVLVVLSHMWTPLFVDGDGRAWQLMTTMVIEASNCSKNSKHNVVHNKAAGSWSRRKAVMH